MTTSKEYVKMRQRSDRLARMPMLATVAWGVNSYAAIASGNLWGLANLAFMMLFIVLTASQLKHIGYWWRPFRPIHVSLLPENIEEWYATGYLDDDTINDWARERFGRDVYCHELGVYSFRKKKHAMMFKLKWGGK